MGDKDELPELNKPIETVPEVAGDLSAYSKAVNELARAGSTLVFMNDSEDHAAIVIEAMIKHASKEILMYDGQLKGDVSGRSDTFLETIQEFVTTRKGTLRMVMDDDEFTGSPVESVLLGLRAAHPERVDIRRASEKFIAEVDALRDEFRFNSPIHFTVGDARMFRIELPKGKRKGYCCFTNPIVSRELNKAFQRAFVTCKSFMPEAVACS